MKKMLLAFTITILLILAYPAPFDAPIVAANGQPPQGTCPTGFELHMLGEHMDNEHHDHHIGLKVDLNEDGLICVKHLKNGLHIHVDNVIP